MHSEYIYCFMSWVWSHQPIACHFLQISNNEQDYSTAGTSKERQEMAVAASETVDEATGDSHEKEEAASPLNVELGGGTTSTGDPKENDGSEAAGTSKKEGSGGGPTMKGGSETTDASKQEQKGRTSGVTETPRAVVADNTDDSGSKIDCSIKTTRGPEETEVVKLHAFIQPGAWHVDIKKNPHVVEIRSDMNWNKNCAEIKLT